MCERVVILHQDRRSGQKYHIAGHEIITHSLEHKNLEDECPAIGKDAYNTVKKKYCSRCRKLKEEQKTAKKKEKNEKKEERNRRWMEKVRGVLGMKEKVEMEGQEVERGVERKENSGQNGVNDEDGVGRVVVGSKAPPPSLSSRRTLGTRVMSSGS